MPQAPGSPPPNADEIMSRFKNLFEEMFAKDSPFASGGTPSNDVMVKLAVTRKEVRRGTARDVTVERRTRCTDCGRAPYRESSASPACKKCREGFVWRSETLKVKVPAGVMETGMKLRLAGKGHETKDDTVGDAYVEIEVLPSWWQVTIGQLRGPLWKRPAARLAALLVAPVLLLGAVYAARAYEVSKMPGLGASCAENKDCGSGQCLALYDQGTSFAVPGGGTFRGMPIRKGGVCSDDCTSSADCPATMACVPVERHTTLRGMPALPPMGTPRPNASACSPR